MMGQADEAIRDGNYSHQLEPASDDRLPTTTARYRGRNNVVGMQTTLRGRANWPTCTSYVGVIRISFPGASMMHAQVQVVSYLAGAL